MGRTEYHVQLWKSDVDSISGQKKLNIAYPLNQARDVIITHKLRQDEIPQNNLEDVLLSLGDLAFTDREQNASTSNKGIVQLSSSIDSESETTAATSRAVKDLHDELNRTKVIIREGNNNGCYNINGEEVPLHGIKSAAFEEKENFATSLQGEKADNALPISGGTLTGPLTLSGVPSSTYEAVNKKYVDDEIYRLESIVSGGVIWQGVIMSEDELPREVRKGWEYKCGVAGIFCGYTCRSGDMLIASETTDNAEHTSDFWDYIPSANEHETYIKMSNTGSNLSYDEFMTGEIILGDAASKTVRTSFTKSDLTDDIPTTKAIVNFINDLDLVDRTGVTHVKGANETTYRAGYVNLTPENIGAATSEQGEKADSAIQRIIIGNVSACPPDGEPSIVARHDIENRATHLDFVIPKGETVVGPTGDTGPMGPTGPAGPTGDRGMMGPTGPKGDDGVDGDRGPIGPTGPTGPMGESIIGPTGPTGARGSDGDIGPTGPMGPTGRDGIRGNLWYTGNKLDGVSDIPTIYPNSEIPESLIGDCYLNTANYRFYQCTQGGIPAIAKWLYLGTMSSGSGGGASPSPVLPPSEEPENDGVYYSIDEYEE
jgi:hypothetical protein